jgi:hypothetical protein
LALENFIAYLTDERVEPDSAVAYHSQLFEQHLTGESSSIF